MKSLQRVKLPEFSVLMSVYDSECPLFLDSALKSIETQTVLPKELVLVEDGPLSEYLIEVIQQHKNLKKIKIILVQLKKNVGLGLALREGTKFITTNIIARMDSDDISLSDRFEIQLKMMCEDTDIAILGGQLKEFHNSISNIVGKREVPESDEKIKQFLKFRSPFNHPTVMMKKKALEAVGGYTNFPMLEDYYLWGKFVAANYKCANTSKTVLLMRTSNGMYNRRGGWKYMLRYFQLKKLFYNWNLISKFEQILSDIIFTINSLIPSRLRAIIYRKLLHKKI